MALEGDEPEKGQACALAEMEIAKHKDEGRTDESGAKGQAAFFDEQEKGKKQQHSQNQGWQDIGWACEGAQSEHQFAIT